MLLLKAVMFITALLITSNTMAHVRISVLLEILVIVVTYKYYL